VADTARPTFDYDSRPVTRQVAVVGQRASAAGYRIRDFLSRNGVSYEWVDVDDTEKILRLLPKGVVQDRLPICILPSSVRLNSATMEEVAAGLGMVSEPRLSEYDLTIVGDALVPFRDAEPVRLVWRRRCMQRPKAWGRLP
jgi:thioredoxin reductase (NADPH)